MRCANCLKPVEDDAEACPSCGDLPLLEGRYALMEVLGEGATATLHRAVDQETARGVAIKERHPAGRLTPEDEARFAREVRVLRQLDHPQIPDYLDAFASGSGRARRHYLVQELVDGSDLQASPSDRRRSESQVLAIVQELAKILTYLHGLSPPVVHRDIKPGNVMRRRDGTLVLVDFGAVRDTLPGTLGGQTVAGTFGYMAPEQFQGDATPASDLYALGALAVALLSREDPATHHDRLGHFHWRKRISVSKAFEGLLARMLDEDPSARPTAREVAAWRPGKAGTKKKKEEEEAAPPPPSRPSTRTPAKSPVPTKAKTKTSVSADSDSSLDALAASGRRRMEEEARQEAQARTQAKRQEDRERGARERARIKRRREGLVGPVAAVLFRHQRVVTVGSVLLAFGVLIGLSIYFDEALEAVPEWMMIGVFLVVLFSLPAAAIWIFPRALVAIAAVASGWEHRRLLALGLPLDLSAYLSGLSEHRHQGRVRLDIHLGSGADASALVDTLGQALKGAGLDGYAHAKDGILHLTGPKADLLTLYGKRLESSLSHHYRLHRFTRAVLRRVLVPASREVPITRILPHIID